MYKRFLASLLTLCMLLTLLPAAAMAAEVSGEEIPEKLLSIGEDEWGQLTFETFEDLTEMAAHTYDEHTNAIYYGSGPLVIKEDLTIPENLAILIDEQLTIPEGVTFSFPDGEYSGTLWAGSMLVEGTANCSMLDISNSLTVTGLLSTSGAIHISYDATLTGAENIVYENDWAKLYWQCGIYDTATLIDVANSANSAQNDPNWFYRINLGFEDILIDESINLPANCQIDAYGRNGVYTTTIAEGCTLDLDCDYTLIRLPFVVNGTICNNSGITIKSGDEYDNGSITFSEGSTYTGAGEILIYSDELTDPQDAVPGLDLSQFDIVEVVEDWGEHYWKLIPKGQSHTHSYTSVVTDPTCTEKGYTTYTCSCGNSYVDNEAAALGHSWDEGVVTQEPTNTEAGVKTYTCTRANCGETKTEDIPALEHTHSYTSVVTDPTCTEKGYTTYTCECGDSYVGDEVDALGHSFEDGVCTECGEAESSEKASVTRVYGDTRYETAYAVANELKAVLGVEKFDTIIVACGSNFPDALSGSYLAAIKDAPILLAKTNNDALLAYIQENLSDDGLVYILGSDVVVSKAFEDSLKAENIKVERLAGATRYLTNLAILEESGITGNEMLISTSMNYADSLSASSTGLPILLINNSKKDLTTEQKEFLAQRDSWKFYILGSKHAVCEEFEAVLSSYGEVIRIYGNVREETSLAIARDLCPAPESMVLAYSQDFPDGLCGGVLAYNMNAPLILTRSSTKMEELMAQYVDAYGVNRGVILGSSKLISDSSAKAMFQMADDAVIME